MFQKTAAETGQRVRTVAFAVCPGITLLDPVGPPEVRAAMCELVPGFRTVVPRERIEPMGTDIPPSVLPGRTLDEVPGPDALPVPGGLPGGALHEYRHAA
ncbi:hypothetical protein [Kitasatospora sp. HPMI-4]|uniref:hypothetical protein n=1 Tax=Kitasatospora sp. HPMI-4 TaxID=3448443 RepID=UPI003F1A3EE4